MPKKARKPRKQTVISQLRKQFIAKERSLKEQLRENTRNKRSVGLGKKKKNCVTCR